LYFSIYFYFYKFLTISKITYKSLGSGLKRGSRIKRLLFYQTLTEDIINLMSLLKSTTLLTHLKLKNRTKYCHGFIVQLAMQKRYFKGYTIVMEKCIYKII